MKSNRIIIAILAVSSCLTLDAQSVYPGQHQGKRAVEDNAPSAVKSFDLKEVWLLPGRVRENLERDSAWLANISAKRMLHSFRNNAGVYAGVEGGYESVKKYGGWESLDCDLRGHTTGHLLSAYGLMYAATGDEQFKLKGDSLVAGLAEVQAALGDKGYLSAFPEELINRNLQGKGVWAPWYTLHKLLSGLIDQYLYADNEQAMTVAKGMGNWAYGKLKDQSPETRSKMLRNEFGGMNEAFYNLYSVTGNENYKWLAEFFYHDAVLDPLCQGNYDFETKHTNTFIPKLIGEARSYELTNDSVGRAISGGFWNEVVNKHTFASGSCSQKEHFFPVDKFSKFINGYTGESCCTYNMLKLSKHLFSWTLDAAIADFYERALFNHILGQQDPESGMVCYFMPLMSGSYKLYSTPEQSFWCCVGSGFESHAKYAESIYYNNGDGIFVNLLIPSRLDSEKTGWGLRQITGFPYSDTSVITVEKAPSGKKNIALRYPSWSGVPTVKVNGRKVKVDSAPSSYININRKWRKGDRIEVCYPMSLRLESTPDNPDRAALFYGPVLLAGNMGAEGVKSFFSDPTVRNDYYTYDYKVPASLKDNLKVNRDNLSSTIKPTDGKLEFKTSENYLLRPFFDTHHTRHVVYWNLEK